MAAEQVKVKVKADTREAQRAITEVRKSLKKLKRSADEASAAIQRLGKIGLSFQNLEGIDDGP